MIKNNSLCHVVVLCILSGEQRNNCFPYPPIYTNIYTTIQIVLWKMTSHRNFSNELIFACYFLKISYYILFLWSWFISVSKCTLKLQHFQLLRNSKSFYNSSSSMVKCSAFKKAAVKIYACKLQKCSRAVSLLEYFSVICWVGDEQMCD